jgi:alpha-D-xyloside xylohydrolase
MINRCSIVILFLVANRAICGAADSQFEIKESHPDHSGITLRTAVGKMRIEFCGDQVVHVVASRSIDFPPSKVPAVTQPCTTNDVRTSVGKDEIQLSTSKVKVRVNMATGAITFLSSDGKTVLAEPPLGGKSFDVSSSSEAKLWQVQQTFLSPTDEALYGLGQHQEGFFNLRNIPVRLLQANTNIAIPFVISTKGYGLLWNNPSLTDFDPPTEKIHLDQNGAGGFQTGPAGKYGFLLSGNYRDKLRLSVGTEQVISLENMWLPLSVGAKADLEADSRYRVAAETGGSTELEVRTPSDTTTFRSQMGDAIDYYFLSGPELTSVVSEYRDLTGAAPLLPRWAYGFWQCRERYASQQQILDIAAEFRRRKIPVDVLVQDWQYWGKYGWNAMRFDERSYPDPAQMMTSLHDQNLHMVISVWGKFGAETTVDRQMVADGLVLKSNASTGEPGETKERENWADLFNPRAGKAFWSDLNHDLFSSGIDGWWLDASEPEGDPLKEDETYLGPGVGVRNAFPLFETSAVYQGQRATTEAKRVVILSRSAFAGQQRNSSISWSGDISANWETLRRQVAAGLEFGMSGFPYWTTDIGGFFRPRDQYTSDAYHEILVRWFQFGAFCPIFRVHGYQSETEMWKYGTEVERVLQQYDDLRYRLLPYIYSAAWGVTNRNETMMQALPLVYPKDRDLESISDEFLFGDSLLISPVLEQNARERQVTLPAGLDWINFWTGEMVRGGQTIRADAPLDRIPIFVKSGSIVPMGPVVQSTAEPEDRLEIRVYPGRDADYILYQDSGDGYAYERKERATIPIHWDDHRGTLELGRRTGSFAGMPQSLTVNLVLVKMAHGAGDKQVERRDRIITYKGEPVPGGLLNHIKN